MKMNNCQNCGEQITKPNGKWCSDKCRSTGLKMTNLHLKTFIKWNGVSNPPAEKGEYFVLHEEKGGWAISTDMFGSLGGNTKQWVNTDPTFWGHILIPEELLKKEEPNIQDLIKAATPEDDHFMLPEKFEFLSNILKNPKTGHILPKELVPWAKELGLSPEDRHEDRTSWWSCTGEGLKPDAIG